MIVTFTAQVSGEPGPGQKTFSSVRGFASIESQELKPPAVRSQRETVPRTNTTRSPSVPSQVGSRGSASRERRVSGGAMRRGVRRKVLACASHGAVVGSVQACQGIRATLRSSVKLRRESS